MPAQPRLAFYAWPKPFTKPHIATIQRNAIRSWQLLEPRPDIMLFGNDPGIAEAAQELGVQHIPEGPPLVDSVPRVKDLAAAAEQLSSAPFLCFINADIILTQSFVEGVAKAAPLGRFLLGASPWDTDVPEMVEYGPGWEEKLRARAYAANCLRPRHSADFIAHPRGFLIDAPEVLAGRWYVDNGLMWFARKSGAALIDGTSGILTIHQSHDYGHLGQFEKRHMDSEGAIWNLRCIGGDWHLYTWSNATHTYSAAGVQPYPAGRMAVWPTHPSFKRLNAVHGFIARGTRTFRGLLGMRRNPRSI